MFISGKTGIQNRSFDTCMVALKNLFTCHYSQVEKQESMTKECHTHKPKPKLWYNEEETQNINSHMTLTTHSYY